MTRNRKLLKRLRDAGFRSVGGTKHDKYTDGKRTVVVPRHEVSKTMERVILREAGLE